MPWVKGSEKARAKYITVKEFANNYGMSLAQAYRVLAKEELEPAVIKTGTRGKKVNQDLAFNIMQQIFA